MAKKNEIVENKDSELPAYLQGMEGAAVDDSNFDQSDIVVPRIKLLQGLSNECEVFDDAKAGRFWNTGMDESLGEEIRFVIASRKKKYLLVAPLEDGQGILARAEDFVTWDRTGMWEVKIKDVKQPVTWAIEHLNVVASGLDKWGTYNPNDENSPPAATLFYEYLVLMVDESGNVLKTPPAVISLTRSQIRKAKKGLNDKIKLQADMGRPMQALIFKAGAIKDNNSDGQDFKNWQFTSDGFAPEATFHAANQLSQFLKTYVVQDEAEVAAGESEGSPEHAESGKF